MVPKRQYRYTRRIKHIEFSIVIVSSEQGQDKKHTLLDCRWYNLRLDRTIYKAKAGIKVVCYFYSWEVLDRIVPHKHAETKRPVEEHNSYLLKYQAFVETLVHQIGQIIFRSSKSQIWMITFCFDFLLAFERLLIK